MGLRSPISGCDKRTGPPCHPGWVRLRAFERLSLAPGSTESNLWQGSHVLFPHRNWWTGSTVQHYWTPRVPGWTPSISFRLDSVGAGLWSWGKDKLLDRAGHGVDARALTEARNEPQRPRAQKLNLKLTSPWA